MKPVLSALFTLTLILFCSCDSPKSTPETLVTGGYDQTEMDYAISKAQSEVDDFIATMNSGNGEDFAVKAPIKDGSEVEHFWLTNIRFVDGKFTGLIGNDPGVVTNVAFGQEWTLGKNEISDWMFMRDGKMHGNYTMRPLLKTMPEKEAAMFRSILANP